MRIGRNSFMFRIERLPKRTYVLFQGDREIGRLIQPSSWKERAEILLPEGLFEITGRKGFWATGLTVKYSGLPVMEITYTWKGGGKLQRPGRPERSLEYIPVSFWKQRFKVIDHQGNERMILRAKHTWKSVDPDHTIEMMHEPPLEPIDVLAMVHAINIGIRR